MTKWYHDKYISVTGYCYANGNLLTDKGLADYFCITDTDILLEKLRTANGIFSFIIDTPDFKATSVGDTRIYPVYYKEDTDGLQISNDFRNLLSKSDKLSDFAVQFYKASSFTPAGLTLIDGIKQVKPFHLLVRSNNNTSEFCYKTYLHLAEEEQSMTECQIMKIIDNAFKRTIDSVNGRQIVIPLSGGYDSRLIACMMKLNGYENVICYTIGAKESQECSTAFKVAKQLGFRIYLINPADADAKELFSTSEFRQYSSFTGGLTNFLWLYEFFAIKKLKSLGVLEDGAVFIPGHSGDFLAGSQLYKSRLTDSSSSQSFCKAILDDRFIYGHNRITDNYVFNQISENISAGYTSISSFNWFTMTHLLTHCINNAARAYLFFDYDVRLPFWDRELLDAFLSLPFTDLKNCSLYRKTLTDNVFNPLQVNFASDLPSVGTLRLQHFKNRIKKLIPSSLTSLLPLKHDITGEWLLAKELVKEFSEIKGCSTNELLLKWYLMIVNKQP
ncbi:MAG: asparagine synthase C-terminal domain-containing protein [Paludibacteraceae bacterium]|nr:asparagine synthase C-terminal domain-containing protein [Paludibacteraceae bacterium]